MTHTGSGMSVVWIELGSIALGVPTALLLGIRTAEIDEEDALDLDVHFAFSADPSRPRRVLDLKDDVRFATRAHVFIDDGTASLHPLPPFVAAWGESQGVSSLATRDDGFGWVIDPSVWRNAALAPRAEAP